MVAISSHVISYPESSMNYFSKVVPILSAGTMLFSIGLDQGKEINIVQNTYSNPINSDVVAIMHQRVENTSSPASSTRLLQQEMHVTTSEVIEYDELKNLRWTGLSMEGINLSNEHPLFFQSKNTIKTRIKIGESLDLSPIVFNENDLDNWDDSVSNAFKFESKIKSNVTIGEEFPFTPIEWD